MYRMNPGMKLWWNNRFAVVDFFKKKYGEPVECLRVEKDQLIAIRASFSKKEDTFSKSYFKISPE